MIIKREPNMEDMKKNIIDAGGLFYQYRACSNNASTIYDIENIKHNVLYAQTPLNMNDPFDSKIGFCSEKFYEECINMMLDPMGIDKNIKTILFMILKYKLLGNLIEFVDKLNKLKQYLVSSKRDKHLMRLSDSQFINDNIKNLYRKAPREIKDTFSRETFLVLGIIVTSLESDIITEELLISALDLQSCVDQFIEKIEDIKNNIYPPLFKKFLSQLTITCFTSSGWNNQLMWSHYANSYSGICVEYDLTKMEEFFGLMYPVQYTEERPTISPSDLGTHTNRLSALVKGIHGIIQRTTEGDIRHITYMLIRICPDIHFRMHFRALANVSARDFGHPFRCVKKSNHTADIFMLFLRKAGFGHTKYDFNRQTFDQSAVLHAFRKFYHMG